MRWRFERKWSPRALAVRALASSPTAARFANRQSASFFCFSSFDVSLPRTPTGAGSKRRNHRWRVRNFFSICSVVCVLFVETASSLLLRSDKKSRLFKFSLVNITAKHTSFSLLLAHDSESIELFNAGKQTGAGERHAQVVGGLLQSSTIVSRRYREL